jgi:L-lysine 6-transaminase
MSTPKDASRTSSDMIEELKRYVVVEPHPFVVDLQKSEGMWLATRDGRRLFDWAGYYGAKLIGHNHPLLYEPEYVTRLVRAANNKVANPDFLTEECLDYYRTIYELAPRCMLNDRLEVYAVNSGAEAVENMMKYLINLYLQRYTPDKRDGVRRRFIYFDQAFHGRTVFALNVTELKNAPVVTSGFQGINEGNIQVPFPAIDTDASEAENAARTEEALARVEAELQRYPGGVCGIVVEPLQGAGGHRVAQPEFYRGLSRLAHEYDVYLGFDEVQTAGGQTGTFFAVDQFELPYPPQAIAAAKKMACGVVYMLFPMEDRGVLDSTWGGTLADMVRFVQEMRIVWSERLIEAVPEKAKQLVAVLRRLAGEYADLITNVRGLGLYQGFSMRRAADKGLLIETALRNEDLLLLGAGLDSIRLRPNLSVTTEDIAEFGTRLERALATVRRNRSAVSEAT